MMNEILFFIHILSVLFFIFAALVLGKNALLCCVILQSVLANLFVIKQITLFGMNVTCGNVYIVGTFLGLNLLQEFFGKDFAQQAIRINFLLLTFYIVMTQFQLGYIPNAFDQSHDMFLGVLSLAPRITLSSLFAYFLMQKFNLLFYGFLKRLFNERLLFLRNIFTLLVVQLFDTILFTFLGLYGIVESVFSVIILSFFIKVVTILVTAPLIPFLKKLANKFIK